MSLRACWKQKFPGGKWILRLTGCSRVWCLRSQRGLRHGLVVPTPARVLLSASRHVRVWRSLESVHRVGLFVRHECGVAAHELGETTLRRLVGARGLPIWLPTWLPSWLSARLLPGSACRFSSRLPGGKQSRPASEHLSGAPFGCSEYVTRREWRSTNPTDRLPEPEEQCLRRSAGKRLPAHEQGLGTTRWQRLVQQTAVKRG